MRTWSSLWCDYCFLLGKLTHKVEFGLIRMMESITSSRYPWQIRSDEVQSDAPTHEQNMEAEVPTEDKGNAENANEQPSDPQSNDDLEELERSLIEMERVS